MISEAFVPGTAAVLISPMKAGVHREQAKEGLIYRFAPADFEVAGRTIAELLRSGSPDKARQPMLSSEMDVTDWHIGFFERGFDT